MKINSLLQKLRENRVKVIIVSTVISVAVIGGVSTYFLNCNNEKDTITNEEVLSKDVEEVKEEESKEIPKDEVVKEDINKNQENVQEPAPEVKKEEVKEQPKEKVQEKPKANTNVTNKSNEQNKVKEQPKKEVKKEEKQQVNNNPVTYTSKSLGIAFDMPASWRDKYFIKENTTEVSVYMKHKENADTGIGFLFVISSDLNSHGGGEYIDSIGGKKHYNIGGKEFLAGGPLDFPMHLNDPKIEMFKTMNRERSQVLSTLRLI